MSRENTTWKFVLYSFKQLYVNDVDVYPSFYKKKN